MPLNRIFKALLCLACIIMFRLPFFRVSSIGDEPPVKSIFQVLSGQDLIDGNRDKIPDPDWQHHIEVFTFLRHLPGDQAASGIVVLSGLLLVISLAWGNNFVHLLGGAAGLGLCIWLPYHFKAHLLEFTGLPYHPGTLFGYYIVTGIWFIYLAISIYSLFSRPSYPNLPRPAKATA